jgi:hypothetical protein
VTVVAARARFLASLLRALDLVGDIRGGAGELDRAQIVARLLGRLGGSAYEPERLFRLPAHGERARGLEAHLYPVHIGCLGTRNQVHNHLLVHR